MPTYHTQMSCFCPKVQTCLSPREKNISQHQPYLCLQENSPWNTSLLKRCKILIDSRYFCFARILKPIGDIDARTCSVCSMEQNWCTCWGNQLSLAGNQTNSMMPCCLKNTHKRIWFLPINENPAPHNFFACPNLAGPTNETNIEFPQPKHCLWGEVIKTIGFL